MPQAGRTWRPRRTPAWPTRSGCPSDHRYSIATVRPSIKPSSRNRSTNAVVLGIFAAALLNRKLRSGAVRLLRSRSEQPSAAHATEQDDKFPRLMKLPTAETIKSGYHMACAIFVACKAAEIGPYLPIRVKRRSSAMFELCLLSTRSRPHRGRLDTSISGHEPTSRLGSNNNHHCFNRDVNPRRALALWPSVPQLRRHWQALVCRGAANETASCRILRSPTGSNWCHRLAQFLSGN